MNIIRTSVKPIMTPAHKRWDTFCSLLAGEEGCNFTEDESGKTTWTCKGGTDKSFARKILKEHFPKIDIEGTMAYFEEHGGCCDCEILFNVGESI